VAVAEAGCPMHRKNPRLVPTTEFGLAYFGLLGVPGMLFVSAMTAESLLGPLGPFSEKVYVNHAKPVRVILYGSVWLGLFLAQAFVDLCVSIVAALHPKIDGAVRGFLATAACLVAGFLLYGLVDLRNRLDELVEMRGRALPNPGQPVGTTRGKDTTEESW